MSFGSISHEAHTTLAIAMNRIGGKSTAAKAAKTDRFLRSQTALGSNQQSSRSRPAVSASPGIISSTATRFRSKWRRAPSPAKAASSPVTKSTRPSPSAPFDARRRTDLAAAAPRHLFDRRPRAADLRPQERQSAGDVRVKLVSEAGVGTVAAGVAKAHADHRLDLRPRGRHRRLAFTSIKHAGCRGSSVSPRPSKRWCATICAAASLCRPTAASAPAATS